jgi:peptide/nickel transport system ATP-binding protein
MDAVNGAEAGSGSPGADAAVLSVRGLSIAARSGRGAVLVTRDVSFDLQPGERVGVVGESGCGKTATGLAILGLLPPGLVVAAGQVRFRGDDLLALPEAALNRIRGRRVSMIFQEPMSALDPVFSIGRQLSETLRAHHSVGPREAKERCIDALDAVGIPLPRQRYDEYPYQLSGGMRQRAMIAIATICQPEVLIADEATTALDVTIQAQIIELLTRLSEQQRMALLFISHDLGAVASACTRLLTMYAGEIVEDAPLDTALLRPQHPYTAGLLAAIPHRRQGTQRLVAIPGRVPRPDAMPGGCRFAPRCSHVQDRCVGAAVALAPAGPAASVRCLRSGELALGGVAA